MSPLLEATLEVLLFLQGFVCLQMTHRISAKGAGCIGVGAADVEDAVGLPGEKGTDEEVTAVGRWGVWRGFFGWRKGVGA